MNQDNSNFAQPTQDGLSGAPVIDNGGSYTPNPNKTLLQVGVNPGRIVEILDLGTQMVSFGNSVPEPKRQIRVAFEHAHLKQQYNLDKPDVTSAYTSKEASYIFGKKSFIYKLICLVEGRDLSIDEAKVYPLQKLMGAIVGVNISHKRGVKDPSKVYEKIESLVPWNEATYVMPPSWNPEMDLHYFYIDQASDGSVIGNNFMTKTFANLPYGRRQAILESAEAKAYAKRGGKFAENPKTEERGPAQAGQPQPIPPSVMPKSSDGAWILEMIDKAYSYEAYIAVNYTPELLVEKGLAKWVPVAPSPAPVQPAGPAPIQPAPVQPQQPAPIQAQPVQPVQPVQVQPIQAQPVQPGQPIGPPGSAFQDDNDEVPF